MRCHDQFDEEEPIIEGSVEQGRQRLYAYGVKDILPPFIFVKGGSAIPEM